MKKLFFFLLLFPVFLQSQESLIGSWVSEDKNTRGLTKCNITYEHGAYLVELWGSCLPKDCYWGKTSSAQMDKGTEEIMVRWEQGFVNREQSIGIKEGKLNISTTSKYNDGRESRLDYEIFVRKRTGEGE